MPEFHPDDCECPACIVGNSPECCECHRLLLSGSQLPLQQTEYCSSCGNVMCSRCIQNCSSCHGVLCSSCMRVCKTCGKKICRTCADGSRHCGMCKVHVSVENAIVWGNKSYCSKCDPFWEVTWEHKRWALIASQVQTRLERLSQLSNWLPTTSNFSERCQKCHEYIRVSGFLSEESDVDVCTTHYEVRHFHKHCLETCACCGIPYCRGCKRPF